MHERGATGTGTFGLAEIKLTVTRVSNAVAFVAFLLRFEEYQSLSTINFYLTDDYSHMGIFTREHFFVYCLHF